MEKPKLNYIPGSMSFSEGFLGPKGDVGFFMKYSHKKATDIINEKLKEGCNILSVEAGLDGDFRENSCEIFDGKIFNDYTCYDSSQWAEPIIIINYADRPSETYAVWEREEK
jgi:hypothetical protein